MHLRPRPIVQQKATADPPVFILPGRSESHSEALAVNAVTCTNSARRDPGAQRRGSMWDGQWGQRSCPGATRVHNVQKWLLPVLL